jgi:hypothetical protein
MMDLGLRPALALRDPPATQINVYSLTNVTTIMVAERIAAKLSREQDIHDVRYTRHNLAIALLVTSLSADDPKAVVTTGSREMKALSDLASGAPTRLRSIHRQHALGFEDLANATRISIELGGHFVQTARPWQIDIDDFDDASRPRSHHDDAVRQQDGFRDAMRDVQRGLATVHPEPLDVHRNLLARERVERAERLVHQQHWKRSA